MWQEEKTRNWFGYTHAFPTTSPASRRCVFRAFLIRQLTTLYSGHMASDPLTLPDEVEHHFREVEGTAEDPDFTSQFLHHVHHGDPAIVRAQFNGIDSRRSGDPEHRSVGGGLGLADHFLSEHIARDHLH